MKFKILWLIWGLINSIRVFSQQVSPTAPDFMDITQPWVVPTYGTTKNPFEYTGTHWDRHVVITEQGTDRNTGGGLSILPEGVSKVIRLGNSKIGGEAESLTYRFIVDRQRPVLLLNFAVILEDPGHEEIAQPRFVMQVLDRNEQLIESCTEYDVRAGGEMNGFHVYYPPNGHGTIRWRDWTSVGTNLSGYAGEEVQVRFITYDCDYQGHFGYAYFYASCVSAQLSVHSCESNGFELTAPDHFEAYLWSNGQTEQTSQWLKKEADQHISCQLTSVTGCEFSLFSKVVKSGYMPRQDTLIYDTICEGDAYRKGDFDLPSLERSGTFTNTYIDVSDCNAPREITAQLALHVLQRYIRVEEEICGGEDYDRYGFHYQKPAVGSYKDTLQISTSGRCGSYRILDLHVAASQAQTGAIIGDTYLCGGMMYSYRISSSLPGEHYEWQYPKAFTVFGSKTLPEITLRAPESEGLDSLKLQVVNGCGATQIVLPVEVSPSYRKLYEDSVCTGVSYRKYGLSVAPKEETGNYVEYAYYKTLGGCDSTIIVQLEVFSTPNVSIELKDSVFCTPQQVTLTPVIEGAKSRKNIKIGDVLCKDGSIVSLADYKTSGKTAKGIVFWIDQTGLHGWAVDVWENERPLSLFKGTNDFLQGYYPLKEACKDFDGKGNTQKILDLGTPEKYPAIVAITYEPEWYLPALGQLDILFCVYPIVNNSLKEVNGSSLRLDYRTRYYSSTMSSRGAYYVWMLVMDNGFSWMDESMVPPVAYARGICNF